MTKAGVHATRTRLDMKLVPSRRAAALVAGLAAFVGLAVVPPAGATHTESGYWMLSTDGHVYGFGGGVTMGETVLPGSTSRVDIEPTPSGHGYWILSQYGSVYNFGDAAYLGTGDSLPLGESYVSMSATPDGQGYWLFTNKGRVIRKGSAQFYGDMSAVPLNGPVLDSVATPSGLGYWMVASDGGVFSFGDAKFYGSMGGTRLNKPVMSLAPDPDGIGYWLVASDGGIFAFDAPFFGSMGSTPLNRPVSGMVGQPGGYLMVAEDGGIFAFGTVEFHGSLGSTPPASPVVAVAAIPKPPPPPVMEFVRVFQQSGSGSQSTTPFYLTKNVAKLTWSCGTASSYTAGCNFVVRDLLTGSQLDYASGDPGQSASLFLHPDLSAWYYVDVSEFSSSSDTSWSVLIEQERCVSNCLDSEPPPPPLPTFSPVFSQSGSGGQSTSPLLLAKETAKMIWSCGTASSYSAGCSFVVKNYQNGSQVDYVSGDPGQNGTMFFHPDAAASYYVEVDEFSSTNDTTWTVVIEQ